MKIHIRCFPLTVITLQKNQGQYSFLEAGLHLNYQNHPDIMIGMINFRGKKLNSKIPFGYVSVSKRDYIND